MSENKLIELLARIEELRAKAAKDGSLTLRIPLWITAGDGRDYLRLLYENGPKLAKIVRKLIEQRDYAYVLGQFALPKIYTDRDNQELEKILNDSE